MTYARKSLVSLSDTPYYHLIARCVRRAWLWGVDEYAGKDYSHRKVWVLKRLTHLAEIFTIDLCAYAIMSNHYHLVVRVDQARARALSEHEVIGRWTKLFSRPLLIERWEQGACSQAERELAERMIKIWRKRLCDVSWYMRCLNEHLARRANLEDNCKGRFWEGRFKSQALLDEAGLLTAMAYVDLNPVRAGIAETPEEAQFTSIYERIQRLRKSSSTGSRAKRSRSTPPLLPLGPQRADAPSAIPFSLSDYLELVDWTGRIRVDGKHTIIRELPKIMHRLQLDPLAWRAAMRSQGNVFGRALGRVDRMQLHAETLGQSWVKGLQAARRAFG